MQGLDWVGIRQKYQNASLGGSNRLAGGSYKSFDLARLRWGWVGWGDVSSYVAGSGGKQRLFV